MKAGATTVFRLERENSWIAHTPTDNYFLVDERAKEVIEFLERSSSTEQAWENYQSRALVAPRVTESRFHDIRHLITRGSPKKITAVTGLSARRIIFSKSNTIQLSAAISILSPRQSLLPVSLSFVVMALLALQHGFSRPVAGGLMQTVSTVILVACSLFVHELGHASALARAGGAPRCNHLWLAILCLSLLGDRCQQCMDAGQARADAGKSRRSLFPVNILNIIVRSFLSGS